MDAFPWYATELFLGVCDAGGLSAASRFGKSGISQPALSAQMMTLEKYLGWKLFERKPFRLTNEGMRFQEEALRLRTRMNRLREDISTERERPLRVAASDVVIRDYLPGLFKEIDMISRTRLVLREAASQELAGLVKDGEADLAIGMLSRHVTKGATPLVEILAKLSVVLLVPPMFKKEVREWTDLIRILRSHEKPGLISLPQNNLVMQHIRMGLRKSGLDWNHTLEVSSISQIATYVDLDFGFGFGLKAPHAMVKGARHGLVDVPGQRIPAFQLGVWHRDDADPLARKLLTLMRNFAREHLR